MLCVHRKGARAFHPATPGADRLSRSWPACAGAGRHGTLKLGAGRRAGRMEETFGSTCHGAGRAVARRGNQAARAARSKRLLEAGVIARARGRTGLAEEQPAAYKDVSEVVDVVHKAGLAKKVARLKPIGVIKG